MNNTEYIFTDSERRFFTAQVQQLNALQVQVNSNLSLVVAQQELQGNWRMKQDLSGIELADQAPMPAIPPMPLTLEQPTQKRVNGL